MLFLFDDFLKNDIDCFSGVILHFVFSRNKQICYLLIRDADIDTSTLQLYYYENYENSCGSCYIRAIDIAEIKTYWKNKIGKMKNIKEIRKTKLLLLNLN